MVLPLSFPSGLTSEGIGVVVSAPPCALTDLSPCFPPTPQGNTGVLAGLVLVSFGALVALVTVLSGIGVGEHCGVGSGGVYSMITAVLGGQTGGTIGLLYVFGQVRLPTCGMASLDLPSAAFSSTFHLPPCPHR